MAEANHGNDSYFERITDNLRVMIWRTDKEGDCVYLNKLWCDFTGRSLEDSIRRGWQASVHPRDVNKVDKIFSRAVKEKKPFELSYYLKDKNGDFFMLRPMVGQSMTTRVILRDTWVLSLISMKRRRLK